MTWNPLFDLWVETALENPLDYELGQLATFDPLTTNRTVAVPRDSIDDYKVASKARSLGTRIYSWAVPSPNVVAALAAMYKDCGMVDPMAGTGYWAEVLFQAGLDVMATDLYVPEKGKSYEKGKAGNWYHGDTEPWCEIVEMDARDSARKHSSRAMLLSWPPYEKPIGAETVTAYHEAGGTDVVYIGEGPGGCTGDDRLYALLGIDPDPYCGYHANVDLGEDNMYSEEECVCLEEGFQPLFEPVVEMEVPQWWGIHDRLTICRRVGPKPLPAST